MKTIFTYLFVSVALFGFAQQNTFKTRVFVPSLIDLYQMIQLSDGSFVGVGDAYLTTDFNRLNIYLLKTDAAGNVLASKGIESLDGSDDGSSIAKTSDGGFIISGSSDSGAIELIKFKADLSISWQKMYSITGADQSGTPGTVLQTPDGGYMVTNSINVYTEDASELAGTCLLKTDALGNVQFAKQYFDITDRTIYDIVATTDGNYVMLGGSFLSYDSSYLIKIDPQGSILWSRGISENAQTTTHLGALSATSDGGILITGESNLDGNKTGDYKLLMIKYNNAGALQWSKKAASGRNTASYGDAVTEDSDGGYVFAGGLELYNGNGDTSYAYAVKTDKNGNLVWTRAFDGNTEEGYADVSHIIKTSDGGFAVCGSGDFYNPNPDDTDNYDYGSFLYKLTADGQVCNEISGNSGSLESGAKEAATNIFTNALSATSSDLNVTVSDIGTIDNVCSSVLPLQLLSFNATLQNKSVAVQWTTVNEVNTSYFMVERSNNATSFSALQQVTAKGNSAGVQSYNTTDLQPLPGTSYYRLKEVDKDGKTTYSSVVPITMLNNGVVIISPNPVQNSIRVIMQSTASASVTCQVIDMKGSVLATQKTLVSSGRNEIVIPAASLVKGVYVLKVIENNTMQTIRFVKE